ncbi:hypothetical protein EVJ50_04595 [Synechococcus sp. RSCCF101]|uniref:hypothetical protein n=1 Tax=Synechococcus sp. RSCCF101 TaxID=2511069 RepID=UPI0012467B46|nr:hypothetical protein [Synechococcus sp. RSCCF101]QEY31639.1 hypothetical protein EVJ50_04595 [Synechococcus sp. RSCCF101]
MDWSSVPPSGVAWATQAEWMIHLPDMQILVAAGVLLLAITQVPSALQSIRWHQCLAFEVESRLKEIGVNEATPAEERKAQTREARAEAVEECNGG